MKRLLVALSLLFADLLMAAPSVTKVSPPTIRAGTMNLQLIVEGDSFSPASAVRVNGEPVPTTYISRTRLRATPHRALAEHPGTFSVDVSDPTGASEGGKEISITMTGPEPVRIAIGEDEITITGLTPGGTVAVFGTLSRWSGTRPVETPGGKRTAVVAADGTLHIPYTYYPRGVDYGTVFAWDESTDRWAVAAVSKKADPVELPFMAHSLRRDGAGKIVRVQSERGDEPHYGTLMHLIRGLRGGSSWYAGGYTMVLPCPARFLGDYRVAIAGDLLLEYDWVYSTWFRISRVGELEADSSSTGPAVFVRDVTIAENAGSATLPIELTQAMSVPVTVTYSVEAVAMTDAMTYLPDFFFPAAGEKDFVAHTGSVTFAPGQTSVPLPLTLLDDERLEHPELFSVRLLSAENVAIVSADARVTIQENDRGRITASRTTLAESPTEITFTVDRESDVKLDARLLIDHQTTSDADFENESDDVVLNFVPGSQEATVTIPVAHDSRVERDERFELMGPYMCSEINPFMEVSIPFVIEEPSLQRRRSARH